MSNKKDSIIRKGDTVIVDRPLRFVRCGYHLTKQMVREELPRNLVYDMFEKLGVDIRDSTHRQRIDAEALNGIAYVVLHARNFGGPMRKIHEQKDSTLKVGHRYQVSDVSYCKTGFVM